MKKYYIFYILIIFSGLMLIVSLVDFKNPISIPGNIENNLFVLAVGVDKPTEIEGGYRLTIIGEKFSSSGSSKSSSSSGKTPEIVTVEGKTIFDCIRNYNLSEGQNLFWGHIKYILISEDVAKENVMDVLDFFIRDHELRLNTTVAVVKDITSESFLRSGEKLGKFIPDVLDGIFRNIDKLGYSKEIFLNELMSSFDDEYEDVYMPALTIGSLQKDVISEKPKDIAGKQINGVVTVKSSPQDNNSSDKESDSKDSSSGEATSSSTPYSINIAGYAVFDRFKLMGYTQDYTSRGINWIHGDVKSGVIVINDKEGNKMSFEILKSSSKIKTKYNGDIPEASITVEFSSNLAELMSQDDIFNKSDIKLLKEGQIEVVKKEVEDAITFAQTNGIDILGVGDALYHQHKKDWERTEGNWNNLFKEMKISVNVELNVNTTYHIRYPIGSKGGEE